MPYLNLYLEGLSRDRNEVHLVYWNRDLQDEDLSSVEGVKLHEFKAYQDDEVSKISKLNNFLKFKKYVSSVLKEGFDFIITLQSVTTVLMADVLLSKSFKGNYIYDYRDCTYESNRLYRAAVEALVRGSRATVVSSEGFKKYLPESEKIKLAHNLLSEDLKSAEGVASGKGAAEKIRVGFWGFLREEKINKEIIKKLANDPRFELHYYGREQKTALSLKAFASQSKIENVFFHGEYNPKEKCELIKNTDIIHNAYCEAGMPLAMSNKFYDGVIFSKPQLCMVGSFMGEVVQKNNVGIALNPESESFANDLYEYYQGVDCGALKESCGQLLEKIKAEQASVISIIKEL